jgi:formate/nitrite transporter FocA (FNT family)
MSGMDAFAPAQIAELVETRGVVKANAPYLATFVLSVLAGAFIAPAFVAAGFEHSVANMYFIPAGLLLERDVAEAAADPTLAGLDVGGFATNLSAATIGNIVGGAVLVGLVYWFVYLRPRPEP